MHTGQIELIEQPDQILNQSIKMPLVITRHGR